MRIGYSLNNTLVVQFTDAELREVCPGLDRHGAPRFAVHSRNGTEIQLRVVSGNHNSGARKPCRIRGNSVPGYDWILTWTDIDLALSHFRLTDAIAIPINEMGVSIEPTAQARPTSKGWDILPDTIRPPIARGPRARRVASRQVAPPPRPVAAPARAPAPAPATPSIASLSSLIGQIGDIAKTVGGKWEVDDAGRLFLRIGIA